MTDGVNADSTSEGVQPDNQLPTRSYALRPCVAEDAAAAVLQRVLLEGGHLLWHRYLAKKAFGFAADMALESALSKAEMRCVAHERGEDMDSEDWSLEPEPQPGRIDSWMRMALPTTKPTQAFVSTSSSFGSRRNRRNTAIQKRQSILRRKKEKHEGPRSWSIEPSVKIPPEEERAREAKLHADTAKREMEKQKREKAKTDEIERARLKELHAEMDQRKHTFDMNGNILWVEQVNLAKLPQMQQIVSHTIAKPRPPKEGVSEGRKTLNVESQTLPKPKPKRPNKAKRREEEEHTDGFTRLNHEQPPILETMKMNPGVSLVHKGKSKHGNAIAIPSGKMTRQEYITMSQREISGNTQMEFTATGGVRTFGGNSGGSRDASPKAAKGITTDSPKTPQALPNGTGSGDTLPPINPGRPPPAAVNSASAPQLGVGGALLKGSGTAPVPSQQNAVPERHKESKAQVPQAAPVAPPMHLRSRKFDSIGHLGKNPRLHMPSMGKLDVFGSGASQAPPIGATMGHGLIRHSLEEYYFPPLVPEPPTSGRAMTKSKSDSAIPRLGDDSSLNDGRILPEGKSPAYHHIRKQLFPRQG